MFSRPLGLTLSGLMLAWLAALLIVAWLVWTSHDVAIDRGRRATAAFSALVEQQVARTLQATYLTLGAVADAHRLTPRPKKNDREFQEMMTRRLRDLPFVRALFVIGPDGRIIHDTDYPRTPDVSLVDRPYFSAYAADPQRAQTVWPPLLSRSGTGWFLPVTRSLVSADRFAGVVVAALQAAHFQEQFRHIQAGEGYLIALFHLDGTLVASYPPSGETGRRYARLPAFAQARDAAEGVHWVADGLLRGRRLASYRVVAGMPLLVLVSRSERAVLAEWRPTALAAGVAMSLLTLFLAWFIFRLARESERRRRERERRAQAEKLEALGQLSGGMAHDFANVLNVVGMGVELLRAQSSGRPAADEALATVERAVRSGRQVAERLLSFARKKPLALARVDLGAWLEAARPLLAQAAGPRVQLSVQSERPLPEVLCDLGELDVAVVNLVANARDAMAGSGRVTVRAFAEPPRFVCLLVQDEGRGMTDEVRRQALDPFFTTKGEAGTGLGLSQVYGFMRQLGGHIAIESAPGRGTVVRLSFPAAPPP